MGKVNRKEGSIYEVYFDVGIVYRDFAPINIEEI